jgi:hypothetical protein
MTQSQTLTGRAAVAAPTSAGKIGILTPAIMNVVAVVSLRGLPAEAEYGLSSIFYYLFAAVVFLIPVSRSSRPAGLKKGAYSAGSARRSGRAGPS